MMTATNSEEMLKYQVLILCTGNSCRSQMAEGLINHELGEEWQATSAGTEPAGFVHPLAVAAMQELDIDIASNASTHVDAFRDRAFDHVVTVCDDAAENCPLWLGQGRVTHMAFPDPAKAPGSREEQMAVFRQVRDDIRRLLLPYLRQQAEDRTLTP